MKFTKGNVSLKKEKIEAIPSPIPVPEPPKMSGVFKGLVISQAPNPQWIYVKLDQGDGKVAVIIPRRLTGKMVGKRISVEAISDATGTSYRYVQEPQT